MSEPITLLIASADGEFREMVRDNLLNVPGAKIAAEYPEVSPNLYVRVLQDLERNPNSVVVIDLSGDSEQGIKTLERLKQAAPDLYVIASHHSADGDTVIQAMRVGAKDFILQPVRRNDFREAIGRFERAPKRAVASESKLGKVYTFLGTKGGVGTTTLAVNFASVLSQRGKSVVLIDLDWTSNDAAMQLGATPQYTLAEVAENLHRMDQALFESFVTRDALGFFLIGPADQPEQRGYFTESMFREFTSFLIEKYDAVVIDAGRNLNDEVVQGACQTSTMVFLTLNQEFASVRNAQRYFATLTRMGFTEEQVRVLVNRYQKKAGPHLAGLEQIRQTLNQAVFYGIPESPAFPSSINKARPLVADRQSAPEADKAFRAFVDKATKLQAAVVVA